MDLHGASSAMNEIVEYRRGRSAVTSLHAHLVFVTKIGEEF